MSVCGSHERWANPELSGPNQGLICVTITKTRFEAVAMVFKSVDENLDLLQVFASHQTLAHHTALSTSLISQSARALPRCLDSCECQWILEALLGLPVLTLHISPVGDWIAWYWQNCCIPGLVGSAQFFSYIKSNSCKILSKLQSTANVTKGRAKSCNKILLSQTLSSGIPHASMLTTSTLSIFLLWLLRRQYIASFLSPSEFGINGKTQDGWWDNVVLD